MNTWILRDRIKRGFISFKEGDEVVCFNRKSNGHPKSIKESVTYVVKGVDLDGHLMVHQRSGNGIGFLQPIRVHKIYMIPKIILRDIKLNNLLNETNW
jgi:hypothetical protein